MFSGLILMSARIGAGFQEVLSDTEMPEPQCQRCLLERPVLQVCGVPSVAAFLSPWGSLPPPMSSSVLALVLSKCHVLRRPKKGWGCLWLWEISEGFILNRHVWLGSWPCRETVRNQKGCLLISPHPGLPSTVASLCSEPVFSLDGAWSFLSLVS